MNSVIAHKGFITFLIISGIVFTTLIGFNIIAKTQTNRTDASDGDEAPLKITTTGATPNSITILWVYGNDTPGDVVYSKKPEFCELVYDTNSCFEVKSEEEKIEHQVTLTGLEAETVYYFKIKSKSGKYYPEGEPVTFTTMKPEETVDEKYNTYYVRKYTGPDYRGIIPTEISKILELINGPEKENTKNGNTSNPPINGPKSTDNENNNDINTGVIENTNTEDNINDSNPSGNTEEPDVLGISTSNLVGKLISEEFYTAVKYGDKNYDFNNDGNVDILDYPLFIDFISNGED